MLLLLIYPLYIKGNKANIPPNKDLERKLFYVIDSTTHTPFTTLMHLKIWHSRYLFCVLLGLGGGRRGRQWPLLLAQ